MKTIILFTALAISLLSFAENVPDNVIINMAPVDLPKPKPVLGTKNLLCVAVSYTDMPNPSYEGKAPGVCNQVRSFYLRNSRNKLDVKVRGVNHRVPYPNNRQWDKIKYNVKQKYPNYDYYALMVGTKLSASHAGGGVAWLRGSLYRDAQHEFGHLLGLGHAGRYEWEKGKWVLHSYNDGESVMGRFPSDALTGPQYRWVGWLPKDEVEVYDETKLGKEFEIKRVTDTKQQMLSLVAVPVQFWNGQIPPPDSPPAPNPHRDAFLSFNYRCDSCLSLHLSMGGGSQKVAMFGNEFYDSAFTGMHVKVTESSKAKIKFTIDFEPKPPKFTNETQAVESDIAMMITDLFKK